MRTEQETIGDLMAMVKGDRLGHIISGSVYRDGMRPRDSQLEDIVVIHTTGDGGSQIQEGVVTVLIYVPDIAPLANGVYCKDGARIEELEHAAKTFVESLSCDVSDYRFSLRTAIKSIPITETHQHAISVSLSFRHACTDSDYELPVLAREDDGETVLVTGCAYLDKDARIEITE